MEGAPLLGDWNMMPQLCEPVNSDFSKDSTEHHQESSDASGLREGSVCEAPKKGWDSGGVRRVPFLNREALDSPAPTLRTPERTSEERTADMTTTEGRRRRKAT